MEFKTRLKIQLSPHSDPFADLIELKNKGQVLSASVTGSNTIVVCFDNRQLSTEELLVVTNGELISEQKEVLLPSEEGTMRERAKRHKRLNHILNTITHGKV